jgi:hypothetical protein
MDRTAYEEDTFELDGIVYTCWTLTTLYTDDDPEVIHAVRILSQYPNAPRLTKDSYRKGFYQIKEL